MSLNNPSFFLVLGYAVPVLSRACDFSPGQTLTDLGTPFSSELRVRPQRQVLDGLVAGMSLNFLPFFFVLGYAVPVFFPRHAFGPLKS